ncbi:MAG: DUF4129 domain-containing protein [Candidatus Dormiibacterota bacterium]
MSEIAPPPPRERGRRWAAAALAVVGALTLLVLAALATHASYTQRLAPAPSSSGLGVTGTLVSVSGEVVITAFLALVDIAVLLTLFLMPWHRFRNVGRPGPPVVKLSRWARAKLVALALCFLAAEAVILVLTLHPRKRPRSGLVPTGPAGPKLPAATNTGTVQMGDAILVGLVVAVLATVLIVGYIVYRRRQSSHWRSRAREAMPSSELPQELAGALDIGLDDLAAGTDPREAVILAYARMERALSDRGMGRRNFETHLEYLERALRGLRASQYSLRKLTDLFERARFSQHEVGAVERLEAEGALARLRDELRAAAT